MLKIIITVLVVFLCISTYANISFFTDRINHVEMKDRTEVVINGSTKKCVKGERFDGTIVYVDCK